MFRFGPKSTFYFNAQCLDFGRNYFYWKEDLAIVNFHNGLLYIRIVVDGYALKKFKTKTIKLDNIRGKTAEEFQALSAVQVSNTGMFRLTGLHLAVLVIFFPTAWLQHFLWFHTRLKWKFQDSRYKIDAINWII